MMIRVYDATTWTNQVSPIAVNTQVICLFFLDKLLGIQCLGVLALRNDLAPSSQVQSCVLHVTHSHAHWASQAKRTYRKEHDGHFPARRQIREHFLLTHNVINNSIVQR